METISDAGFEGEIMASGAVGDQDLIMLRIEGMTCSSCSSAVERALRGLDGVRAANVNLLAGQAEIAYDPDVAGPRHILRAVGRRWLRCYCCGSESVLPFQQPSTGCHNGVAQVQTIMLS